MKRGFTIIEILLVLAILSIAVTFVTVSFGKLNASRVLEKETALTLSILDEARALTLSSKEDSSYGVHFEDSVIVLFKGDVYSSSDPDNVTTSLDPRVGIRDIAFLGGGVEVFFKRLTGDTDEPGTLEIFLRSSSDDARTVEITVTGIAQVVL